MAKISGMQRYAEQFAQAKKGGKLWRIGTKNC